MPIDGSQTFIDRTEQTHELELPLGAHNADLELQIQLHAERMALHYPEVHYHVLNLTLTKVDDLYGEPIGGAATRGVSEPVYNGIKTTKGDTHGLPIEIPAMFVSGEQRKLLKAYGMESEHDALVVLSCRHCKERNLKPKTGDLIAYLGINYEVATVKFGDYFLNTQVPLSYVLVVKQSEPDVED